MSLISAEWQKQIDSEVKIGEQQMGTADVSKVLNYAVKVLKAEIQGADMSPAVKSAILSGILPRIVDETTCVIDIYAERASIFSNIYSNAQTVNLAALYNFGGYIGKDAIYSGPHPKNKGQHIHFNLRLVEGFAVHKATYFTQKTANKIRARFPECVVSSLY